MNEKFVGVKKWEKGKMVGSKRWFYDILREEVILMSDVDVKADVAPTGEF